ncbi:hypothetical protein AHAS_Ahas20G0055100 [Arachis hypogaea]
MEEEEEHACVNLEEEEEEKEKETKKKTKKEKEKETRDLKKEKYREPTLSTPALTQDDLKKFAADKAVEYVKSSMVLGLGTGSTAALSLPSSVISTPLVNSPTSSVSLPSNALRNWHVLSESRSLSSTTIPTSISSSTAPMRWTRPQSCKRLRRRSFLLKATFDEFIVVVDETKLVSGLEGVTLRCRWRWCSFTKSTI